MPKLDWKYLQLSSITIGNELICSISTIKVRKNETKIFWKV